MSATTKIVFGLVLSITLCASSRAAAQGTAGGPTYLKDRGTGVPTSMFATFINKGELIIYPFFEHYRDRNFEYKPEEFGHAGDVDFRGRFRAREGLFFIAYGVSRNVSVEFEMAGIHASLDKSSADHSTLPPRIAESGLGDVEGQIRWRWREETARRPELFSYVEVVIPHHGNKLLIGTPGWESKFGTGVMRGFRWGTIVARGAIEYSQASSSHFDLGEYAVEYLRRVSPKLRVYMGVEGSQDELSFVAEAQWHVSRTAFVRFNNGVGLTSKATDWAPEIGIVLTLPVRR
jgi:hypothetical protein